VNNTEWHNIVSWNHAELCEKYVSKGSQLYVEGKLRTRTWDDKDGNKRYVTEILAEKIDLLGKRESSEEQKPQQQAPVQQRPQQTQTTAMPYPTETDDSDLPF
jgi:single-strand DNA-binding protein